MISGGVTSRILPRQVAFDSLQVFSYVLKPTFRTGDQGFDRVLLQTPAELQDVSVKVGGRAVTPLAVARRGDSLLVDLPERVRQDSVEVVFQTRIQTNATAFEAWVSTVGTEFQQGVQPEDQHASTVFVPAVATGGRLIRLVVVTPLLTPNGDGVNDTATIRFALAKVESTEPEVSIHDLSGRRVRMVSVDSEGYGWDGRDDRGQLRPPGAYICRILAGRRCRRADCAARHPPGVLARSA